MRVRDHADRLRRREHHRVVAAGADQGLDRWIDETRSARGDGPVERRDGCAVVAHEACRDHRVNRAEVLHHERRDPASVARRVGLRNGRARGRLRLRDERQIDRRRAGRQSVVRERLGARRRAQSLVFVDDRDDLRAERLDDDGELRVGGQVGIVVRVVGEARRRCEIAHLPARDEATIREAIERHLERGLLDADVLNDEGRHPARRPAEHLRDVRKEHRRRWRSRRAACRCRRGRCARGRRRRGGGSRARTERQREHIDDHGSELPHGNEYRRSFRRVAIPLRFIFSAAPDECTMREDLSPVHLASMQALFI